MKTLSKVAVLVAAGAATAAVIRRYDLVNKGTALVEQGVEKVAVGAEWFTAKATEVVDNLLTKFSEMSEEANDPTEDEDDNLVNYVRRERAEANGDVR